MLVQNSFRLLMEYHSFLSDNYLTSHSKFIIKFPSPYGVSFILIIRKINTFRVIGVPLVSVSLRSIIHSYKKQF